jgi:hypothetical protein
MAIPGSSIKASIIFGATCCASGGGGQNGSLFRALPADYNYF